VQWVESMQALLGPQDVKWIKGTTEEYDDLCDSMVANGSLVRYVGRREGL
jgi:GTP-dependent phosphoenolpyruvate carboxykinase